MSLSAFHYWKHQLAGTGEKRGFVRVPATEARSGRIRVDYESGIQISFDSIVQAATISYVLFESLSR